MISSFLIGMMVFVQGGITDEEETFRKEWEYQFRRALDDNFPVKGTMRLTGVSGMNLEPTKDQFDEAGECHNRNGWKGLAYTQVNNKNSVMLDASKLAHRAKDARRSASSNQA